MHGRLGDGPADGLEDEGVSMDDVAGCGRAWEGSRLYARQGTGVSVGASNDVTQDFCMAGMALSPKVATACDQCKEDRYGQN